MAENKDKPTYKQKFNPTQGKLDSNQKCFEKARKKMKRKNIASKEDFRSV